MSSDNARGTSTDVKFRQSGTGHASGRLCDQRKGMYLCGKPAPRPHHAKARATCLSCAAAKAEAAA